VKLNNKKSKLTANIFIFLSENKRFERIEGYTFANLNKKKRLNMNPNAFI
jgi:hypothetical protein